MPQCRIGGDPQRFHSPDLSICHGLSHFRLQVTGSTHPFDHHIHIMCATKINQERVHGEDFYLRQVSQPRTGAIHTASDIAGRGLG